MAPGEVYLHMPNEVYGFESGDEPLLNLWLGIGSNALKCLVSHQICRDPSNRHLRWAERVIDVKEVPRVTWMGEATQ